MDRAAAQQAGRTARKTGATAPAPTQGAITLRDQHGQWPARAVLDPAMIALFIGALVTLRWSTRRSP